MSGLNLIMPMAGRGSRFAKDGIAQPKPLIDLAGKPFFWWAVESVRRAATIDEMVFVVLQEHIAEWQLNQRILDFYPGAVIIAIPEVTSGAAETAYIGALALKNNRPIVINDCDHAFVAGNLDAAASAMNSSHPGLLMTFESSSPNYSYVELGNHSEVLSTVEKKVVSPYAIAGCYLFESRDLFSSLYAVYARDCPYPELFISGIYNKMLAEGLKVNKHVLAKHFAFGTPDEYAQVLPSLLSELAGWR